MSRIILILIIYAMTEVTSYQTDSSNLLLVVFSSGQCVIQRLDYIMLDMLLNITNES